MFKKEEIGDTAFGYHFANEKCYSRRFSVPSKTQDPSQPTRHISSSNLNIIVLVPSHLLFEREELLGHLGSNLNDVMHHGRRWEALQALLILFS